MCKEVFVAAENEGCLKGELEGQNVARSNIRQGLWAWELLTLGTGRKGKNRNVTPKAAFGAHIHLKEAEYFRSGGNLELFVL